MMTPFILLSITIINNIYLESTTQVITYNCNSETSNVSLPGIPLSPDLLRILFFINPEILEEFSCENSKISFFSDNFFSFLPVIKKFNLSENNLTSLKINSASLNILKLNSNLISSFEIISPSVLTTVELNDNNLSNYSLLTIPQSLSFLSLQNNIITNLNILEQNNIIKNNIISFDINKSVIIDLRNNFISQLTPGVLFLLQSGNLNICPQLKPFSCYACDEEHSMEYYSTFIKSLAGKVDISCLVPSLPPCGRIKFSLEKNILKFEVFHPDIKKVFMPGDLSVMLTSEYFDPIILTIGKQNILKGFIKEIILLENFENNFFVGIENVNMGGFEDPLIPRLSYFVVESEGVRVVEVNEYFKNNKLVDGFVYSGSVPDVMVDEEKGKEFSILIVMMVVVVVVGVVGIGYVGVGMWRKRKMLDLNEIEEFEKIVQSGGVEYLILILMFLISVFYFFY